MLVLWLRVCVGLDFVVVFSLLSFRFFFFSPSSSCFLLFVFCVCGLGVFGVGILVFLFFGVLFLCWLFWFFLFFCCLVGILACGFGFVFGRCCLVFRSLFWRWWVCVFGIVCVVVLCVCYVPLWVFGSGLWGFLFCLFRVLGFY